MSHKRIHEANNKMIIPDTGKYKTAQLIFLMKLYIKLDKPFNLERMMTKSRTQLKRMTAQARRFIIAERKRNAT